ncbi:MAG: TetR/AcrR family transcriptional regulator [Polyangiales bacterium]
MSRQINKERTRLRLLQAILKTIHRFGHGTLTTGRVAQLAGVAQPTFYVHFRSMDQALEQVAEWVALELGPAFSPDASPERDRAAEVLEEAVVRCTRSLIDDRKVAEVFLRNRRDATTPLGRRWNLLTEGLRERMEQMVFRVRPDIAPSDAALHADLLVSIVFGLAEAELDGRVSDLDRAAAIASRAIVTSISSNTRVADAA